ncbi:conserved hypothetical protein [Culex quinquefasciatus]|uniref:Nanos-type domain-containing protein n=1 Tax=Culex quinquefasciatus TaxID=7176 RepID=B0WP65_CULQU|nr:conserved hypothetical protein [Culex quinquefasciatus]|eukprot:XP_001850499.1 conserved hypothetical protein [Culex quinquefasciatus]
MATGEKIGMSMKPQTAIATSVAKHEKENKLNWQDQWELLKKSGQFCNFCKKNKELREIYQSHDLKGPDGTVTCPVLKRCVCQCCGEQGHTIAYCPRNASGTSILQMINHHNRLPSSEKGHSANISEQMEPPGWRGLYCAGNVSAHV